MLSILFCKNLLGDIGDWLSNTSTLVEIPLVLHLILSIKSLLDFVVLEKYVFSLNTGNYRPEKTPYLGTFHAVPILLKLFQKWKF